MIYLDSAATTPVDPRILREISPLLGEDFGNPSSTHELGASAARALAYGRELTARAFGVRAEQVIFTSGGTESNNLAIKGLALANPRGKHVVVSAVEHESVGASVEYLRRFHGFDVDVLAVDHQGLVSLEELERVVRADTTLAVVTYANHEVGTIQDIPAIGRFLSARGIPLHVDAVQGAPHLPLNLDALNATTLSISGHKLGAPKGIGALTLKRGVQLEPLIHGGGQENAYRSGTPNVAFALALGLALSLLDTTQSARLADCSAHLIQQVRENLPDALLTGSEPGARLPGHASFCFPGINGETLLIDLERAGVIASSGSACAAGASEPSAILLAMGYEPDVAHTAVRFTMDHHISEEHVQAAAHKIITTVRSLRG